MSTPIKFKELQIRNFLSFGNNVTVIDLSADGSTLITGQNIDANSNNGAGKCVQADTPVTIRNKLTGEIRTIPIGQFFNNLRESRGTD